MARPLAHRIALFAVAGRRARLDASSAEGRQRARTRESRATSAASATTAPATHELRKGKGKGGCAIARHMSIEKYNGT